MNFLSLFVLIPLLMILALFVARNRKQVLGIMVAGSSMLVTLAAFLAYNYITVRNSGNTDPMLFTAALSWFKPLHIQYAVGVDGVSVVMLCLSAVIVFTGTFVSWKMAPLTKEFFLWFSLLATGVFGFFISLDLFTLFLFYETALIPMYLLIGVWGSGRKEYSAMKLTLMLMGSSMILLVGILGIYFGSGATSMHISELAQHTMPVELQYFFFTLTFFGFGVLGALFPFHTWSPDGHASAPTAVSMLHAGVLMKLGGYGSFRVAITLMPAAAEKLSPIFLVLTGIGVVYGAMAAIRQTDLKYINAYSSVSHCNLVLFAILMLTQTSLTGAVLQMLSHGLITALFFALIGMIYGRTHTRLITDMGGLMKIMPFLGASFVIAGFSNIGVPGFSGFVAEMTIFVGSFENGDLFRRILTIAAVTSIVIGAVYILLTVGKFLQGPLQNEEHGKLDDAHWFERLAVVTLIAGILYLGSFPTEIANMISDSFGSLLQVAK
ncbi:MAG: NADH dehydrogenase [Bacteroidetes bacterium GWD2_45_23]|nr:MAG: NADH dehydrogenase [Bacteroidetes bacterium GWC2_46_850]OFX86293.1 MAG: NADH dehydrogenase [Bacteroidetes bacterium GWD2_45_23]HBA99732.1 NADH-quinone oxidoreductase subunit M [Porphyromonadaceae bacterium]HCC17436.1 NADH-quinone oxidoreductase subunit M [Porphyromonadaceae bacterium]